MTSRNNSNSFITRRGFLAGTGIATAAILARPVWARAFADEPAGKPNSVIDGVHIGAITYSYRGEANTAEETLKALVQDGLSECELMDGPIRAYTGITMGGGRGRGRRGGRGGADQTPPPPPQHDAAHQQQREAQLAKCVELRKMYNNAGVNIHCEKLPFGRTDEEIDFNFQVAKALGCKAITTERNETLAKRVAPFAEKHKIYVGFHNHEKNTPVVDHMDPLLEISPYIGLNLDIGHYVAGTHGKSPVEVIEKYHDRITNLHIKDRTADGKNLPFGKGTTPIKEVLQLLKKNQWPIYADIELEYQIPKGSNSVAEVAKAIQYCREALA